LGGVVGRDANMRGAGVNRRRRGGYRPVPGHAGERDLASMFAADPGAVANETVVRRPGGKLFLVGSLGVSLLMWIALVALMLLVVHHWSGWYGDMSRVASL
jgi:hypothetical protein